MTDHDGDVMAVRQWQGAVHVQDVVLSAQEALQVLRVRGHLLGNSVHTPPADQSLHEQQRHSLLFTIHHHLKDNGHKEAAEDLFTDAKERALWVINPPDRQKSPEISNSNMTGFFLLKYSRVN